jgi:hypothetical protein
MLFFSSEKQRKALTAFLLICTSFVSAQNPQVATPVQASPNTEYYQENRSNNANQRDWRQQRYYSQNYQNSSYNSPDGCYEGCDPCETNECCEGSFWDSVKIPIIGVVSGIVGGIIGAEIVGKDGHSGHDGDPGPSGPTGPQGPGFLIDAGETLTFALTSLFPATPAGTVSVVPFVTDPSGITYDGPEVVAPTAGGTTNYAPIVIPNPIFGFYNFGLQITNTSLTTLAGITLNGTLVFKTRDSSVTNEITPLAGVSIAPGTSQISSTYTYDGISSQL